MKQPLTKVKGEIDSNTVIAGDFSTTFLLMDSTTTEKIKKEIQGLKNTIDQLELIDI